MLKPRAVKAFGVYSNFFGLLTRVDMQAALTIQGQLGVTAVAGDGFRTSGRFIHNGRLAPR